MALICAVAHDRGDLRDREAELVVAVIVVRPEAETGVGAEVAEDLALGQLLVDGLELRCANRDRSASTGPIPGTANLEAGLVEQVDEQLCLAHRVLSDPVDADLLDQVVAGGGGVQRGHVRSAREEAGSALGVLELRFEAERSRVRLPAHEGRLERLDEIGANVEPAVARPAAQPFDAAADGEVDVERGDVQWNDPGGLIRIEHDVSADIVSAAHDRLDVLDLGRLEENVRDRHEQRPFVDRAGDRLVVWHDDDLELRLRLVQVANTREVAFLVDDAAAQRVDGTEARQNDR